MSRILLVGDAHLRDTPPVNCTHDFLVDLWHSLEWIAEESHRYDAVIFAGDVFDFKQPSKTSHALILRAIDVFGRMHNAWCVAGNHDLSADRIESLAAKQPLGVLIASGAIRHLDGWMTLPYDEAPNLPVFGIPWQQEWANPERRWMTFEPYRLMNGTRAPQATSLVVTHAPLFPAGQEPPYEFIPLHEFARDMGNTGNVFYGHIHDEHGIFTSSTVLPGAVSASTVTFANHGSLNRARLTKSDIERTVQVTVWDSMTGAFTAVPIPNQLPAKDIFRLDAATAAKAEARGLEEFLSAVGASTLDITSTQGITAHIRSMDVPPPVQTKAIDLIEEADS